MNMRWCVGAALAVLAVTGSAQALDRIQTLKGTLPGRVVATSPVKIDFDEGGGGGVPKDFPVNQVQTIFFEEDPIELNTAKTHVLKGRYAEAQAALDRIKDDELPSRAEIRQDVAFYKALCKAKLAMGGRGKIEDAGAQMADFINANAKSYHYFEASEIVGDLLVAIQKYGQAADYYARLDKAPWPDYAMRAGVAAGRALLAQGKLDEAVAAFDRVLANEAPGDLAKSQRTLAKLGKAAAMVAQKKPDEAIAVVEEILKTAEPDDAILMARGYNVLGTAHRQAGHTKEALLAFLHVDLLYPTLPDAHAEALANLAQLWEEAHRPERAVRARETLEEDYKDSPWAKKEAK